MSETMKEEPNVRAVLEKDLPEEGVLRVVGPKAFHDGGRQLSAGAVVDASVIPNVEVLARTGYVGGFIHPKAVMRGALCLDCPGGQLYASSAQAEFHWQRVHSAIARALQADSARRDSTDESQAQRRAEWQATQRPAAVNEPAHEQQVGESFGTREEIIARADKLTRSRVKRTESGPQAA